MFTFITAEADTRGYFKLSFIIIDLGNLDAKSEGYFKFYFIMTKMGNLDAMLWGYLYYVL